jgi:hypothetical protein
MVDAVAVLTVYGPITIIVDAVQTVLGGAPCAGTATPAGSWRQKQALSVKCAATKTNEDRIGQSRSQHGDPSIPRLRSAGCEAARRDCVLAPCPER